MRTLPKVRAVVAVIGVTMLVLSSSSVAGAAGDQALDRLMVKSPVPGWAPLESAAIDRVVSTETRIVSAAANQSIKVAGEGWRSGRSNIVIILSRFPEDVPSADLNARQAVISACSAATNRSGATVTRYAGLDTASEASCSGTSPSGAAYTLRNLSWAKRNVFALIVSAGLSSAQVEAIADRQDALIPSSGVELGSESGSNAIGAAIVGVLVALVVGASVGVFVRSRRRKPDPAFTGSSWTVAPGGDWSVAVPPAVPPAAPTAVPLLSPGWQPVAGDPHRQAYWDGSRWTARKRWDGADWVDD